MVVGLVAFCVGVGLMASPLFRGPKVAETAPQGCERISFKVPNPAITPPVERAAVSCPYGWRPKSL